MQDILEDKGMKQIQVGSFYVGDGALTLIVDTFEGKTRKEH